MATHEQQLKQDYRHPKQISLFSSVEATESSAPGHLVLEFRSSEKGVADIAGERLTPYGYLEGVDINQDYAGVVAYKSMSMIDVADHMTRSMYYGKRPHKISRHIAQILKSYFGEFCYPSFWAVEEMHIGMLLYQRHENPSDLTTRIYNKVLGPCTNLR
jgi:hypothetical protein